MDIVNDYTFRAETGQLEQAARQTRGSGKDPSGLYEACQEFEAIFIKQMLNVMRKTVPKSGLLDGGAAEEIFEDMLYDEYAGSMARTAGLGLADTIYEQLTLTQQQALAG